MHCAICRDGSESGLITIYFPPHDRENFYVSCIFMIHLLRSLHTHQYGVSVWASSKNIVSGAQSAGNQRPVHIAHVSSLVGTSETTRATHITPQFCQWLAMLGYFKQCSPHSFKKQRLLLVDRFYKLYDLRAFIPESIHHSAWQQFMDQWYAKI